MAVARMQRFALPSLFARDGRYHPLVKPVMVGLRNHAYVRLVELALRYRGSDMRLASAILIAAVAVTSLVPVSADAQQRRRVYRDNTERITFIDEQGRARTKITVRPRSYLDGGTEVFPGERKFMLYASPPGYLNASPSAAWDPTGTYRFALPMPGSLPGYQPYSSW